MAGGILGERLRLGVTYFPAAVGPYLWHEYDPRVVESDFGAIAAHGLQSVRVCLAWDAFMPTPRKVSPPRLRNLEHLLGVAARLGLGVVPVIFGQSLGGDVMLPLYAIDAAAARPGVRVVTDGVVQPGGPRDQYHDALMLEVESLWLDTLLRAFANHPALLAWDLGHDPATALRPRRFGHLRSWVELHADRVRQSGDQVRLTLGGADVLSARGVRLSLVAPSVDTLTVVIEPQWLAPEQLAGADGVVVFAAQLAMRLAGEVPLEVETSLARHRTGDDPSAATPPGAGLRASGWEVELSDERAAAHEAGVTLSRLREIGAAGVHFASWSDWGVRALAAPPADVRPALSRRGLVDSRGEATELGDRWVGLVAEEPAVQPPLAWPDRLDVEDYYANLPGSARELHAQWQLGRGNEPD